ncbi:MAG TPA: HYR domain-containing protein [Ohtaekwangia sp.]|nr:HYR domain-containing protein [Ohtaekwangia sp.]
MAGCLLLSPSNGFSQASPCDCPAASTCNECEGGLTNLTFRYDGANPVMITVRDQNEVYYFGMINPGSSFSITGVLPSGRFVGNRVRIFIGFTLHTQIETNCDDDVHANSVFGNFVLTSALSRDGGALCCAPGAQDRIAPVITGCPADVYRAVTTSECSVTADWIEPTATDNCNLKSFTSTHLPGETFPLDKTTVRYTAKDNLGNTSVCEFDVIVSDAAPPLLTCPADISLMEGEGSRTVIWDLPQPADCSDVELTGSHNPGDVFSLGVTTVSYTATDAATNQSSCTFKVEIKETAVVFEPEAIVTPDGNGVNDRWIINDIDRYADNDVRIIDRWGSLIYQAAGYNNDDVAWDGVARDGKSVPTGTYFYVIVVHRGETVVERTGFIELIR